MKVLIIITLFLNIIYSQASGNDFINEFPHGKRLEELTNQELLHYMSYTGKVLGVLAGNRSTLDMLEIALPMQFPIEKKQVGEVLNRIRIGENLSDKINLDQAMRIIKKYCDDNPKDTHVPFSNIAFFALLDAID